MIRPWRSVVFALLISGFMTAPLYPYDLPKAEKPDLDKGKIEALKDVSRGIAAIAEHGQRGVVFVSVSKVVKGMPFGKINPFDFFFGPGNPGAPNGRGGRGQRQPSEDLKQKGLGSGFFVDVDKGYILTNNHVIDEADEISVKLANGQAYDAKVVGRDKNTDVAVVQIKDPKFNRKGIEALSLLETSADVKVGEVCIALGAPFGLEASVSMGVVSALGRGSLSITAIGNFIQTDAAINPGNSGGPLFNAEGIVMGMNTAIFSSSGAYNGIGFAIPADLARNVANQLINKGKVQRGYLGVLLADIDPDMAKQMDLPEGADGALVSSVEPGSPAEKAGLEAGDVVTQVDGQRVRNTDELRNIIGLDKPGRKVDLTYYRDGKKRGTAVQLGNFESAPTTAQVEPEESDLGLRLAKLNPALKRQFRIKSNTGVVILDVQENSAADRSGLQPGDVIVKANKQDVTTPAQFSKMAKDQKRVLIRIERAGQFLFIPLSR